MGVELAHLGFHWLAGFMRFEMVEVVGVVGFGSCIAPLRMLTTGVRFILLWPREDSGAGGRG